MIRSGDHVLWDAYVATIGARAQLAAHLAAFAAFADRFAAGMRRLVEALERSEVWRG